MTENKGDLISRSALRKAFKNHPLCNDVWLQYSREIIDNAPTVFDENAYSQGYKQATCDARASKEKENRDCSTCARYSEFQKEIPDECKGCKHNYFSNYKKKGG